jgi:hypothetical protein
MITLTNLKHLLPTPITQIFKCGVHGWWRSSRKHPMNRKHCKSSLKVEKECNSERWGRTLESSTARKRTVANCTHEKSC